MSFKWRHFCLYYLWSSKPSSMENSHIKRAYVRWRPMNAAGKREKDKESNKDSSHQWNSNLERIYIMNAIKFTKTDGKICRWNCQAFLECGSESKKEKNDKTDVNGTLTNRHDSSGGFRWSATRLILSQLKFRNIRSWLKDFWLPSVYKSLTPNYDNIVS
jgi:hypothetical protein